MRSFLSRYIRTMLLCTIAGFLCCSCIFDKFDDEIEPALGQGDLMHFILQIGALGTSSTQPNDIVEMVNSLRVIVIDKETGQLDVNEKVSLALPEYTAKNFKYLFVRNLNHGDKRVFLIANEEQVGQVSLTDKTGVPTDLPLTSLSALLDYFKVDKVEKPATEATGDGTEPPVETPTNFVGNTFANVLNRVYFKCLNEYKISGNKILLPYSAYYELNVEQGESPITQMEQTLHLVPVATKFDFVITNYRRHAAYVDNIVISSLNSHNYLNAQLNEQEQRRSRPNETEKIWWIDWLESCASESQKTSSSDGLNLEWGWIEKYEMPLPNEPMVKLALNTGNQTWKMDALVNMSQPSTLFLGSFYVPESLNLVTPLPTEGDSAADSVAEAVQTYSLTFEVHDETEKDHTTLEGNVIDTLKSLFRATHVIIYVEFYESEAAIYTEIVPWTVVPFKGYVQIDDEDE